MTKQINVAGKFEREARRGLRLVGIERSRMPLVVAASGGADSTALLLATARIVHLPALARRLIACYVDHNLRDRAETDAERAALEDLCRSLDVPLVVRSVDVTTVRQEKHLSWEDAARRCRYAALAEVAADNGAEAVLTGHTRDDQVETVLLRLLRGTGLRALRGIELQSRPWDDAGPLLVRPLLSLTRAHTEAYCRERGVTWLDDSSNRSSRFLRNRVRHEVLPLLDDLWPGARASLARIADHAQELDSLLRSEVEGQLARLWRRDGEDFLLDCVGHSVQRYVALEVIATALGQLYAAPGPPSERHVRAVWDLWASPRGRRLDLPKGWAAEHDGPAIRFTRARSAAGISRHQSGLQR